MSARAGMGAEEEAAGKTGAAAAGGGTAAGEGGKAPLAKSRARPVCYRPVSWQVAPVLSRTWQPALRAKSLVRLLCRARPPANLACVLAPCGSANRKTLVGSATPVELALLAGWQYSLCVGSH